MDGQAILRLVAKIVSSYAKSHQVSQVELLTMITTVHDTINQLGHERAPSGSAQHIVTHLHVTPEYIVSLETGRRLKTMRRYLMATHGLTPEAYRAKWGLPADYPMVAPNYSRKRRAIAIAYGLGKGSNR